MHLDIFLSKYICRQFSISVLYALRLSTDFQEPVGNLSIRILASTSSLALPLQRFYFGFPKFLFEIIEHSRSFLCLVTASVPLCYKYLFLQDFLFIYQKPSIGVLEKSNLNFQKHQSIAVIKTITAPEISANFLSKHPGWSPF